MCHDAVLWLCMVGDLNLSSDSHMLTAWRAKGAVMQSLLTDSNNRRVAVLLDADAAFRVTKGNLNLKCLQLRPRSCFFRWRCVFLSPHPRKCVDRPPSCAGEFAGTDYAPLLHALNAYKTQYNNLLANIKANASRVPKSIGTPLKTALTNCTGALRCSSCAFPSILHH